MSDRFTDFAARNLPRYLDILHQMVDINTFTANPTGVDQLGGYCARLFSQLDLAAEFVPSVNPAFGQHLFLTNQPKDPQGSQRKAERSIAIIAHLDTVFPPEEEAAHNFHFRVDGERVYGPGTVDIKGGIVMAFAVLETIHALKPEIFHTTRWIVGLDASEETLSDDFSALCLARIPKDALACLVFEGGTPAGQEYPLVVSRKGRAEFKVTAEGRGAHAGNDHKQGANAIIQLAKVLPEIAAFTNYSDDLTFNVGVVKGGSVVNRVPHEAEALVEMRAFSPEIFGQGLQQISALDGTSSVTSQDGYPCHVSVQTISRNQPWAENESTDRLFDLWQKTGGNLGMKISREKRGGLSDGNLLWEHVPVLDGLGPVGTNAHCSERSDDRSKDQEYMLLSSFVPKAALNIHAILKLCGDQ